MERPAPSIARSIPIAVACVAGAFAVVVPIDFARRHAAIPAAASSPSSAASPTPITFAHDVAPIVFAHCAPCHRPGEVGPFSLLTYDDVVAHASEIADVTARRYMPPWRPRHGSVAYANDRSLDDRDIAVIGKWVEAGAPFGDARELPSTPHWTNGWQIGTPDAVLTLDPPYVLPAEGRDVYRNFVLRSPTKAARWVAAWELRPSTRVIHHAILNVDRLGLARAKDALDDAPGFPGMDVGDVQSADGMYLVWAPGKTPAPPDPTTAWRLDEKTDLVLQLHLQPNGKEERVAPSIGLVFRDRPPTVPRFTLRVGDPLIDIAPGDPHYVVRSTIAIPADVTLFSLFPHAHYLAKTVHCAAKLRGGGERLLLQIDDWDFDWQDEYVFASPIELPAGTTIEMEIAYDNSASNPRNPSRPPRRVTTGERSIDEMGNITLQVAPHSSAGLVALREARARDMLARADVAKNHYNLANALVDRGAVDEAIVHYRKALEEEPTLAPAAFNLGNVLLANGDREGAIASYRAAVAAKPDFAAAWVNLGHAYEPARLDDAIAAYRRAIALDPSSFVAHASLGNALAAKNDRRAAIDELRVATQLRPDEWHAHYDLGRLLADDGNRAAAADELRRAIALAPNEPLPREKLQAIEAAP